MIPWTSGGAKHLDRKRRIPEAARAYMPEEDLQVKVDKIFPKLNVNATPGPRGLRNAHLRMWTRVFAPESADEAVEHLEVVLGDMADDKMPPWYMQATQAANVIAIVNGETTTSHATVDHKPEQIPNIIAKAGDKAVMMLFQKEYIQEMMPQQLGVGVKYAAELLVMGLRMTLHRNKDFIIFILDAYCEVKRASVAERHMKSEKIKGMVPYWRAKLGPNSKLWTGEDNME
jgi:hypothetical protein